MQRYLSSMALCFWRWQLGLRPFVVQTSRRVRDKLGSLSSWPDFLRLRKSARRAAWAREERHCSVNRRKRRNLLSQKPKCAYTLRQALIVRTFAWSCDSRGYAAGEQLARAPKGSASPRSLAKGPPRPRACHEARGGRSSRAAVYRKHGRARTRVARIERKSGKVRPERFELPTF